MLVLVLVLVLGLGLVPELELELGKAQATLHRRQWDVVMLPMRTNDHASDVAAN